MTMVARFLPQYPKRVDVTDGLTKQEANGVLTLGFDYVNSEFGAELQQAVDTTAADSASTAADRIAVAADAAAAAASAGEAAVSAQTSEPTFDLVADAEAATIAAAKQSLVTNGYTVLGEGGARYIRVAAEPSHDGKLRTTDRYLPDGTTSSSNGGWWEISEKEIDPLQMPAIIGTDDTANFMHALEYAEMIKLDPRHVYTTHNFLEAAKPVIIDFNGASVVAAPGFTDDNLFKITSSDVIFRGGGVINGTNLPDRTGDFVGADFQSFTVLALGTSGAPLSRVKIEGLRILSGDTACVAAKYCPGISIGNTFLNGINTSATYLTEALMHIQNSDAAQISRLAMVGIKHKGLGIYSSNGFVAGNITAQTSAAGEAAVFCASGCAYWTFGDIYVVGGFGAKADGCNYGTFRNVNVQGNGVATSGVIIQGCIGTVIQGGVIDGFTDYGVSVSSHPTNLLPSQNCGVYDMRITGSGVALDGSAGVYISADATYSNTGTTVRGNTIRTVDKGVLVESGGASKTDNIDVDGNRFVDVKTFALYGPSLSLDFCGNKIEDSTSLVAGVQTWSNGTGERLKVSNNEAYHLGGAAQFLSVQGNAGSGKQVSYNQVEFNNNQGSEGLRPLGMSLVTGSDYIYSLTAVGNSWFNSLDGSAFYLDNQNVVYTIQVSLGFNNLLANDRSKKAIEFVQNAASGAFNGVVENNMATLINKPNNV